MVDLPPPTTTEVQWVAHFLLDNFASALGEGHERVLIGPTKKVGRNSYAFVRITGQNRFRFKLTVTAIPDYDEDGLSDFRAKLDSVPPKGN